jgi:hypothetical protein
MATVRNAKKATPASRTARTVAAPSNKRKATQDVFLGTHSTAGGAIFVLKEEVVMLFGNNNENAITLKLGSVQKVGETVETLLAKLTIADVDWMRFEGALNVGAVAAAAGLPCDVNGSIESGVGNAANLHFALACPAVSLASVIPISAPEGQHPHRVGGYYCQDDIVTDAFPVANGTLLPFDRLGLGIQKLERFRLG